MIINWNWKISNFIGKSGSSMKDTNGYSVNMQVYKDGGKSNYKIPVIYFKVKSYETGEFQDRLQSMKKVKRKMKKIKQ